MYPVSLEAVLPTEEALLAYLLATWTLKSICIFVAVCSGAFAHRFLRCVRHCDLLPRVVFLVCSVCAANKVAVSF
jgi:hypothetical protein